MGKIPPSFTVFLLVGLRFSSGAIGLVWPCYLTNLRQSHGSVISNGGASIKTPRQYTLICGGSICFIFDDLHWVCATIPSCDVWLVVLFSMCFASHAHAWKHTYTHWRSVDSMYA